MLSTTELRRAWDPPCNFPGEVVEIVQGVKIYVNAKATSAFKALGRVFESHSYNVRPADTGAYNCRKITGGTGYSLHAYGIAPDINWNTNPFRSDNRLITDMPTIMIEHITSIRTMNGRQVWGWGGHYRSVKDAMHFEIVCSPADLATGINWNTVYQLEPSLAGDMPLIERGDKGPAVKKLHDLLRVVPESDPGYGTFGPKTVEVVTAYQVSHGLDADGRVGRQTWTAILSDQPLVASDKPGPVKENTSDPHMIQKGDRGPVVAKIHARLLSLSYMTTAQVAVAPELFSAATETAVKRFQTDKLVTGKVDVATQDALMLTY